MKDAPTAASGAPSDMQDALITCIRRFEESEHMTRPARLLSERDRDYRDEKQHSEAEIKALNRRKQPVVTFNRIRRKVNFLLGLERQSRKDPRCFPRTPADEEAAQAATDAIRYACENCRWDERRSEAVDNLIVEGTGIIRVGVQQNRNGIDPDIKRTAWDRFFFDPHSSEFDFSDAAYLGEVIWQDMDEAIEAWPEAKDIVEAAWLSGRDADTYDDKPKDNLWSDYGRRRIRIVEMYYRQKGEWHYCIFTFGGFLVEPERSPFLDEDGRPEHPFVAVSLYIDRDNNRFGDVRSMISPQDEINKRRSKALHLINSRQFRVGRGLETAASVIRAELAKPDGIIAADPGEIELIPTNDMAAANLQMLQEAKAEIDLLGPNAALAGKNEQSMSGRAILAQQSGGMVESALLLDRIRVMSLGVYRKTWNRIRQYWTQERWIRVTDDQRNLRFVGLNRQVTAAEVLQQQIQAGQRPAPQTPQEQMELELFMQSPQGQAVVLVENNLTELDVDIIVDEGVDTPTVQTEQFDMLVRMAQASPGMIPPDVLIEASSLRNKDALLERMRQPNPMAEVQQRGALASVARVESEAARNLAQAAKLGMETQAMPVDMELRAMQAGVAA